MGIVHVFKRKEFYAIALSVILSIVFVTVAVSGATTISTNVNTGGTLTVSGVSTLTSAIYASSTASLDGAVIINDDGTGGSDDFRVESDTSTAMLLVDASENRVGIGTSTPIAFLSIGDDTAKSVTGDVYLTGGLTVGATTSINSVEGSILFSNTRTGDPAAGVSDQGMVYYNATSKVLRMYDGANWFTVGTSTSGLTLSGTRIQMANLATDFFTFGTTTQAVGAAGNNLLTLQATTTGTIPLSIFAAQGTAVQTGNLLALFDRREAELFAIDGDGNASSTGSLTLNSSLFVDGFATTTEGTGNIASQGTATFLRGATFNDAAGSAAADDFIIEGDTITNVFTLDASADAIGVSSSTPFGEFGIEANKGIVKDTVPIFVVGDQGTSTPFFLVSGINGSIGIGTTSPSDTLAVNGDAYFSSGATTTVFIKSTAGSTGGCIEFLGTDGSVYRLVASGTGPAIFQSKQCQQ